MKAAIFVLWLVLAIGWISAVAVTGRQVGGLEYIGHVGAGAGAALTLLMAGLCLYTAITFVLSKRYLRFLAIAVGTLAAICLIKVFALTSIGAGPLLLVALTLPTPSSAFLGMPQSPLGYWLLPLATMALHIATLNVRSTAPREPGSPNTWELVLDAMRGKGGRRKQAMGILVVAALLGGLWAVGDPQRARNWRLATWKACESQLPQVPEVIVVDGFADEVAGIRASLLPSLLSERRLAFVEIKVPEAKAQQDSRQRIDWRWIGDVRKGAWARIELGNDGNPACANPSDELRRIIKNPPFLPDTCLVVRHIERPTARYALALQPANVQSLFRTAGSWEVVDRTTRRPVASLPTVDTTSSFGVNLGIAKSQKTKDCRHPHSVLMDRLEGPAVDVVHVVGREAIPPDTSIRAVDSRIDSLPQLTPSPDKVFWSKAEYDALFSPTIYSEGWPAAVRSAQERGVATYGSQILHWQSRKLVSLAMKEYPWQTIALGEGFLVVALAQSWDKRDANLLAFYRRDGSFSWAARVKTPSPSSRSCEKFWPRSAYVTATHLVLAAQCTMLSYEQERAIGKDVQGETWSLPLAALPGGAKSALR